jgi:O-antigen ligase
MIDTANRSLSKTLINEPLTFLGGLLFFLMLFSPAYNVIFKIILIGVLLISIIVSRVAFDKLNITWEVLLWYIFFIAHGIFFTVVGFLNHNNANYILRTTTYNIFWPIIYLVFTIGIYKKSTLYFLTRVLVISNFAISLYLIGSALTLFGILPSLPLIKFDMASLAGDTMEGLVKTEAPSVVCLLFTVPFVLALTLLDKKKQLGFSKWFLNISIIISIVAVIATARRALILNIFLGVLLTIFFTLRSGGISKIVFSKQLWKMIFWGAAILVLVFVFIQQLGFLDFFLVYDKFLSAFSDQSSDVSSVIRYEQFDFLIKSWLQAPILGHGHGAVSDFVKRSETTPWVYELSYMALLFQTGIVGLLTYLALLLWPIYKGWQLIKFRNTEASLFIIPSIVGCACFLIANATNPYLISYDYMWALFFPIAVINYFMKEEPWKREA